MNIHLQRALSFPFVRTSLYVVGGGLVGSVGGLLVGLFIGGVIFAITPSYNGLSARDVIGGFLPVGMMMGALASSILAGVLSIKTTPSGDALLMTDEGCCDGACEGCECCGEEEGEEEVVLVEAPKA